MPLSKGTARFNRSVTNRVTRPFAARLRGFGVVHHQGALTGGHYVASLKSEFDGKWRLFNDAQIYELLARDVIDPSAYILFYVRRDVKGATLEDFWDTQEREGEGLTEEEVEKLMKRDRCVIS